MHNVILTNKKRYLSALSTGPTAEPYLDTKGIELARRDSCHMVVKTMKSLLDKLILEDKPDEARTIINDTLRELLGGRVDISDLVITKALTKDDYKGKPAHVAVVERMRKRDPSYEAALSDRIPFVITVAGDKNAKLFEMADDPLWVINHGMYGALHFISLTQAFAEIPLDYDYYIHHQLSGPVSRILMWVYGSTQDKQSIRTNEDHLRKVENDNASDEVVAEARKRLDKSMKQMQKSVATMLFGPAALAVHFRKSQSTASQKSRIDSFFKPVAKVATPVIDYPRCSKCNRATTLDVLGVCTCCNDHICFSCRMPVADHGPCTKCSVSIDLRRKSLAACAIADVEDLFTLAAEAKLKCDKCRGYTDEVEIACCQRDCNNLYRRAALASRIKNIRS
jgi:hypothetical protein